MCVSILIDGKLCETMGELRKAIYPTRPTIETGYSLPIPDLCCLCPVDLDATAAALGFVAEPCEEDAMRREFVPISERLLASR